MSNVIAAEVTRVEIRNIVFETMNKYNIEAHAMDGILAQIASEIKDIEKMNLINVLSEEIRKKDEELEKAKTAAKKVLKAESSEEMESNGRIDETDNENKT